MMRGSGKACYIKMARLPRSAKSCVQTAGLTKKEGALWYNNIKMMTEKAKKA